MEDDKLKIKTQGLELVSIGVIAFMVILGLSIAAYKLFIFERVINSKEYQVASYFVVNSETLKDQLLSSIESMRFDDIDVNETENFGVCEIYFRLLLKDKLEEKLRVGLVKVSDYWVVYEATLNPRTPRRIALVSTYQKIIMLMERLDFGDAATASAWLELIKKEASDPFLLDYLSARVNAALGNNVYALQLLRDLVSRVTQSRLSVLFERAMIYFNEQNYAETIKLLKNLEEEYATQSTQKEGTGYARTLFSGMPKDPFSSSLEPENVRTSALKLLALSSHYNKDYVAGLEWSEKAIKQAEKINSTVLRSSSIYVKALNLYSLERYLEAEKEFTNVVNDLDNPNLSQKSWAYYFKGDIAARFGRHEDSLDYLEIAVALEPSNSLVRKGVILYLMERLYPGDLEIALGMALRGIDYHSEAGMFLELASRIYSRLGLADKTRNR